MSRPLFILSFRHRDELSRIALAANWDPIAARRAEFAEQRFVASGAAVAIVDARGALEEGRGAVRGLAEAAEANAAALLVLVSRTDADALDFFHRLGATHFLVSPFSAEQLVHAVRFAQRHAERVGGAHRSRRMVAGDPEETNAWRWLPGSRSVELSPALARKAGLGEADERRIDLMELFRRLDREGRRVVRDAVERTVATGEASAFAHRDPEQADGRLAHHVLLRPEGDVVARVETISPSRGGRDPMTGVADATAARAWLERRLAASEGAPPTVLLVSVSRYDAINAAFGRAAGDAVLQAVARRIERQVEEDGESRLVTRLAGAQFGVMLSGAGGPGEARLLADSILAAIARPFAAGSHVITLGGRAGIAAAAPGDDVATLLRRVSAALAEARSGDGAPVRIVGEGGGTRDDRLEIDLRRALDRDEIEIRFQPQVSVVSGVTVGAEALARWIHPEHGELGAATLFSVADRSDYLEQLSDHVQRKALTIAAGWPDELRGLRLSVNITAGDIRRPDFAGRFLAMVEESGFAADRLTVEVTESGLIDDLAGAGELLAGLRSGGVKVAIDDFGTGYSSLAYLKALPLDYLKLDRRFSQDIAGSARDRIVVRGVIDLARSLGLAVIAEGVETEEQLALLAQEGCNLYQGFLCAPPLTSAELARIATG